MKAIRLFIFSMLLGICPSVSAQDIDWQTGGGVSSSREIRDTARRYGDFTSANSNYGINLWNGGYEQDNYGIVIGYVSKQWRSEYTKGFTQSENFFGEKNKRLHGIQVGLQAGHTFNYGLGIQSGIYFEAYFSSSDAVKERGYDRFNEEDLYIPLHLQYRIPFTRNYGISLYGGIAWQWAIDGKFRDYGYTDYDYNGNSHYWGPQEYQRYGNGWPKHSNWQVEAGFKLRLDMVQVSLGYSYGLTNHRLYNEDCGGFAIKSRQDKLTCSVGLVF